VSEEENKAVIGRWIEAFNERDLEGEADLLASGYVAHVPSPQDRSSPTPARKPLPFKVSS
jgi:hypothetical protein